MHRRLASLALALTAAALAWLGGRAEAGDPKVDEILSRFADEPTVREVQVAAIQYYSVSAEKIQALRRRARMKAVVPGISVGFTGFTQSQSMAVDDIIYRGLGQIAKYEDLNNATMALSLNVTWSLERLVFNAEELDVMSLIGIQDGIQREVTTLYYVRRRLQIEQLLTPPTTIEARISAQLRLEELTGLLNAYTGGYFSRAMKHKSSQRASLGLMSPNAEIRAVVEGSLGMRAAPPSEAAAAPAPTADTMR